MTTGLILAIVVATAFMCTIFAVAISGRESHRWKKCGKCHCHYNDAGEIRYSQSFQSDHFEIGTCKNCAKL